jgi:16S rRNA (guanine527-N7)-methyltransferase
MSAEAVADAKVRDELVDGLASLGLETDASMVMKLVQFVEQLQKWNRVYNLTSVRDPQAMVSSHLLDSLAVARHLPSGRVLDVGTGGGLPGIPLAIVRPETRFTLIDTIQKKTAFLLQAAVQLALPNVEVVCDRIESWAPPQTFDVIISRAFAEMREFVRVARHVLAPGGVMLAMKGVHPAEELRDLPHDVAVRELIRLHVPRLGAERHLIILEMK